MTRKRSKRERARELFNQGLRIDTIAEKLETDPAYVANILIEAGCTPAYADLYTHTGPQNRHARMLAGILRFKTEADARESVARLDALYRQFQEARDRRGQHQAQLLALIGKNRAEGLGKLRQARLFAEWLITHLSVEATIETPAAEPAQPQLRLAA